MWFLLKVYGGNIALAHLQGFLHFEHSFILSVHCKLSKPCQGLSIQVTHMPKPKVLLNRLQTSLYTCAINLSEGVPICAHSVLAFFTTLSDFSYHSTNLKD